MSFAQESTRYCNYSKDKFGNEITYIIPAFVELDEASYNWIGFNYGDTSKYWCGWKKKEEPSSVEEDSSLGREIKNRMKYHWFLKALEDCEVSYLNLINQGYTPQQARQVLPNALKTEIVVTGFDSDWKHFFDLRYFGTTGAPHPDMKLLAEKAVAEAKKAGIWDYIHHNPKDLLMEVSMK